MHNDDIPEDFYKAVDRAARNTADKWPLEEWEDLAQDVWVQLMEEPNTLKKCMEAYNPAPLLSRLAGQIATDNQLRRNLFQGKNTYNPPQVRSMLVAGVLKGYNVVTVSECHDLSYAMLDLKKTNDDYFQILVTKFKKGEDVDEKMKVTRAIDKLTDLMNITVLRAPKYHDGPGARRAISNTRAQYITAENNSKNYSYTHTR